jgi:hypothetical protein
MSPPTRSSISGFLPRMRMFLVRQDLKFARISLRWLNLRNRTSRLPIVASDGPVVSLTTHGRRINTVHLTLESIASGSVLPRRIILWIDDDLEFKTRPRALRRLEDRGLETRLTQNYGPHTKYYPYIQSIQAFETPLVTADDDILYPDTWLSGLVRSFNEGSTVVSCYRAHVISLVRNEIAPYISWLQCSSERPSFLNFATGSYGCIYPPLLLRKLRASGSEFKQLCPKADDVWLHVCAMRAGVKIKQIARRPAKFPLLPGTQYECLCLSNVELGQNDIQIKNTYKSADIELLQSYAREMPKPAGV